MLSQHPNIVGVKDSAGNAVKFAEMVSGTDDISRSWPARLTSCTRRSALARRAAFWRWPMLHRRRVQICIGCIRKASTNARVI